MTGEYDLIIVGGGAGAFAAAIKANELGAKTLIINKGLPLGGTCVNVGCVPSKTLLWAAEVKHLAQNHHIPGLDIEVKEFDFQKVIADELALVDKLREEKYKKVLDRLEHVAFKEGWAKFSGEAKVEVDGKRFSGRKFIIATGSKAAVPNVPGLQEAGYLTHIEALKLQGLPKRLAVLGGGAVALEFAQMFSRFGSEVTLIHRSDRFLRMADENHVAKLIDIFKSEGIDVRPDTRITGVRTADGAKIIELEGTDALEVDEILVATGKSPNTKGLGLENVNVEVNENGAVRVDKHYKTDNEAIFAVGDVADLPLRLETTAGREGTLASENALSSTKYTVDYGSVPFTIFTDPQIAGVGLDEERQLAKMKVCACRTVNLADVPKAKIMRRTVGLVSMSVHPETGVVLGVQLLAPHAGELVAEAMMLVKNKNTVGDLINSLPMFPTLSEGIKLAALSFKKDISSISCCI